MIVSYRTCPGTKGCWRCFWCEVDFGVMKCHAENKYFRMNNGDRLYSGKSIHKDGAKHPDFVCLTKTVDPDVGCDDWTEEVI